MIGSRLFRGGFGTCLPALLIVCLAPAVLRAESVVFRNECSGSVVVQVAAVVRGMLKRDQALVKPGESTPKIPLDTDKIITIYDGKTGRALFRDALKMSTKPLAYSIVYDPRTGRVRMVPKASANE